MTEKAKIITVFGSSRPEEGHADYLEALELGRALAGMGSAVCTGGVTAVMRYRVALKNPVGVWSR